jgi:hypothetical protein
MPPERTAILIIRAWIEAGSSEPLRAHIASTTDVSAGIEHTVNLADADAVVELVRIWLRDVEARGLPPRPDRAPIVTA